MVFHVRTARIIYEKRLLYYRTAANQRVLAADTMMTRVTIGRGLLLNIFGDHKHHLATKHAKVN